MKGPKTSRSLLERNLFYLYEGPKRPPGIKTSSPKTNVYSEIDGFNACVRFPPFGGQKSSKSRGPQNRLSQKERLLWNWRFWCFCGSPHLVARNPQSPGVPKTGSPKRSVYSEIDDFDAFVWSPPFGGQKSSKSWSCKDVDDIHLPGPQFLSNTWWLQLGLLRWKTIVNTACGARHFQHAEHLAI